MLFRGLSAFPITPADAAGRVNRDELAGLLRRLASARVGSVGLLGSTGSYMYLSRQERRRAVEVASETLAGATPLMVGIGALRTDEAVALAQDAAGAGADGLLLAPVSYTPLGEDEVFEHFAAVARATALPLCIYNNPVATHFSFSNALLVRLAAVPGVVAVKNPSAPVAENPERHAALKALLPEDFAPGYSGDWNAASALLAGGACWYSVIGGLLPEPALKLARAAQERDTAEVARLNEAFAPLWSLFQELTGYRVVYAAANALSLITAQPPRPILPLAPEDGARVMAAISALEAA